MLWRAIILFVGPGFLIAGCYFLTVGRPSQNVQAAPVATAAERDFDIDALHAGVEEGLVPASAARTLKDRSRLSTACDERARQLGTLLTETDRIIVRPPFVIAGNVSETKLDHQYTQTVLPTMRALNLAYFDHAPDEPLTLLLYSNERAYRDTSWQLDHRNTASYYGYYIRTDRRIVANIGTGDGTLSHELTHALAHFDFPNMPEWFDEGLASLYEEADFSEDGLQLVGLSNWRLNHLLNAMQKRRLGTLESLVSAREIRVERQAVEYAHARYFCLYLQERGLLPFFYRKFRGHAASDPSGLRTLCEMFGTDNLDSVDRNYRQWVIALYEQVRRPVPHE
ncbi:MAG: hypothetical protein O3B13_19215 [Planctomycetota bacterium]|nr:hypothetical protein [Planctomycetota bacterium]MDA1165234.1 hypothetical protein [Planctomycetota bacterium]